MQNRRNSPAQRPRANPAATRPRQTPRPGQATRPRQAPRPGQTRARSGAAATRRPGARSGVALRPQGRGNPPAKRKSAQKRLVSWIALAVVVGLLWFALDTVITLGIGTPRFYNIYVNGVSLRGYTREEGFELFETIESQWREKSYILYYGDYAWTFAPSIIDADLNAEETIQRAWNFGHVGNIFARKAQVKSLQGDPYRLTSNITYDEEKLAAFVDSIRAAVNVEPVDAVVAAELEGPRLVSESVSGSRLREDDLLELLENLLIYSSNEERIALPVDTIEPELTTAEAKESLGENAPISTCSTSVDGSSRNRKTNIYVALSRFNGMRVDPGQTVSFNEVARERTIANGYKEGIEYSEGESTSGIGGGTCQASTTLYGALMQAGVTVLERYNHSMTVNYVSPSMDAAVTDSGSKDLVFRNDTDAPIYIYTSVDDDYATVQIYGQRPPYRYVFHSVVVEDNIQPTGVSVRIDTEGRYATYTDEKVLVTEGKKGMRSELWRESYDWETGEKIDSLTVQISSDYYSPGNNIYYVGTQQRTTQAATPTPPIAW